jgi:2-keto-4-pentenoate hydratase
MKREGALELLANNFFDAFYRKEWLGGDVPKMADLSITDAYQVQDLVAQKRIELGEKVVGFKVGCTSRAIHEQFGLTEPINARLFEPHIFTENVILDWSDFINCAIEPELVIKVGHDLSGEDLSDAELIDGIEYLSPGIEIHNFKFWQSPPTIQELISSGGILAGLLVGSVKVSPHDFGFRDEVFSVYKDDKLITSAPATEIMGGPLHSLRWLVNVLSQRGSSLKKDSLVIPGSPVELVPIDRDTELKVVIENVGSLVGLFKKQKSNTNGD